MGSKSFSSHPDHVRTSGSKQQQAGQGPTQQALGSASPNKPPQNDLEALSRVLTWFCIRSDGWLRLIPDRDNDAVWLKWKFTSRKWPNHYVMVKGHSWQMAFILLELQRKVQEVELGERNPTLDRPYSST